ncbi:MAG: anaerobic ribonucleoside-triphosphate reductase activating protein [Bacillota bacterium]
MPGAPAGEDARPGERIAVKVAGVAKESVVDGPGLRFVVFAQGCPHHCPGCQNPDTWDPAGGTEVAVAELLEQIKANPLLKGITLSGGEPFWQAAALARLAGAARERGLDVVTYTGYTWERLVELARTGPEIKQLIEASDYIVDGPYVEAQRDLALPFRGSRNQRIIDVRASLAAGKAVLAAWG